jgi:hypothetical protein
MGLTGSAIGAVRGSQKGPIAALRILRVVAFALVFALVVGSGFQEHATVHGGDEEEGRNEDESRFHGSGGIGCFCCYRSSLGMG